jgi:hypothetical protein
MLFEGDQVFLGSAGMAKAAGRFVERSLPPGDQVLAFGNVFLDSPPPPVLLHPQIYLMTLTRRLMIFIPLAARSPRSNLAEVRRFSIKHVVGLEYLDTTPELRVFLQNSTVRIFPCSETGLAICELLTT